MAYSLRTGSLGLVFLTGEKWGRKQYAGLIYDLDANMDRVYAYFDIGEDFSESHYRNYVSFGFWCAERKQLRCGNAHIVIRPILDGKEAEVVVIPDPIREASE